MTAPVARTNSDAAPVYHPISAAVSVAVAAACSRPEITATVSAWDAVTVAVTQLSRRALHQPLAFPVGAACGHRRPVAAGAKR